MSGFSVDAGEDAPAGGTADPEAPPTERAGSDRAVWAGRAIVVGTVVLVAVILLASGLGVPTEHLGGQWQLIDLRVLADDPGGALWYLHTQPPGYNALVGAIAWSPLPLEGTLYVASLVALAAAGLLLHGILRGWGLGPVAAGLVVAVALLNPCLLSALHWGHYEILVTLTLVGALWAAQRHLDDPQPRWLLALSAFVTLCGLVRSLFHPVWVIAAVALLAALRPVARRYVVAALAVPAVLLGGWMLKNQLVFGTPTTSSWLGFNLQRGVVASMPADAVREDVAAGRVSSLALEYPWGAIDQYRSWVGDCEPGDHRATGLPGKPEYGGMPALNFNYECYIPVYRQAQRDAVRLVREHPGRYLSTRADGVLMSYQPAHTGPPTDPTVIDRAYRPWLLIVEVRIPQADWNLPLLGSDHIPLDVSLTLLALSLVVGARGAVAAVRLARAGWRDRRAWPTTEVIWVLVAATVATVVVGGSLVEFGENGRFRSSLDPLLIALPLGAGVLAVRRRLERRRTA